MNSSRMNQDEVVIIVSEGFAPGLLEQARRHHVWAIRTPETERIAQAVWGEQSQGDSTTAPGITLFAATGDPEADLLLIIDTVELHHGLAAGKTLASVFRVLGGAPTSAVRERLLSIGFSRLVSTREGFVASWDAS